MALPLEPLDELQVQILVDNVADALLPGREGEVIRRPFGPAVENPLLDAPRVASAVVAEHGFACLVTARAGGRVHRFLFDAGLSPTALVHNLERLELDPRDIEAVALSHGHFDHTGGLAGLVERLGRRELPVLVHPDAFRQRRSNPPGGRVLPLPPPSRSALEGAGFRLVVDREPHLLFDGLVALTGEVPRVTEFEQGYPYFEYLAGGEWLPEPHLMDDQAVVARVRGRGAVVITGCGHAGAVNIARRALELTGEERLAGIIGGLHLQPLSFFAIPETVAGLAALEPGLVAAGHCTGFEALRQLAEALPEAFVVNAVGTTYRFAAAEG